MVDTAPTPLPPGLEHLPPTEYELPHSDGMKMESQQHVLQMFLLYETLSRFLTGVRDFFIGTDMFVYFSPDQVKTHDFHGPDVFVALDVPNRPRLSWVVWGEDGHGPDIVIELLSDSTAAKDKGEKFLVYQDKLRVPEYFWFHPLTAEFAGHRLRDGTYEPISSDTPGVLPCDQLNLLLVVWQGSYGRVENRWLRWATPDGVLLPTPVEAADEAERLAEQERLRAEQARQIAEQERLRADESHLLADQERLRAEQERQRAAAADALLARYRERFGELME